MNVLLVSQCSKNALVESRRILDQFAERRGDRTWQTAITWDGLTTLRKLLKKTARKNTAVACHWIRGKDHSELLWIVGAANQFNAEGSVPTNLTRRDVLRKQDENNWHTAEIIRLLAQISALLHDLGKASVAFQERLLGKRSEKNLYRHEWVSLRLFQAFVGNDSDEKWLARLADTTQADEHWWLADGRYFKDGVDAPDPYPFKSLPPLAKAIAWLVLTHHRLPVIPVFNEEGKQEYLGKQSQGFSNDYLETPLTAIAHTWNEKNSNTGVVENNPYWYMAGALPVVDQQWSAQAAKVAQQFLSLSTRNDCDWLNNPYVMHLSRLCLMLADHHYSSLGLDYSAANKIDNPVAERKRFLNTTSTLMANTTKDRYGRLVLNQTLVEHLCGVAHNAGVIARALPGFEQHLPRLARHRGLRKRNSNSRFAWQDKAFDAAAAMREQSVKEGAFIINMASTGCGKTLANARILYALSDPQLGMRATYALGLRTLTLQTGRSYRNDLHLDDDELAVLVGGAANRDLFEYYEQQAEKSGSASIQALLDEDSHVLYEGSEVDHPLLSKALKNPDIRRLISAPMLVCTVDHLAPATEALRAGRQIAPMLRLMSSDVILDELDDYDLNDLPALTRLVHWAGLLGSRVVLSSATLPPALVEGMYMAYCSGRKHFLNNRGESGYQKDSTANIPCLWVDEFGVLNAKCSDAISFVTHHQQFIEKRSQQLHAATPLRKAEILPLKISAQKKELIRQAYSQHIRDAALTLHKCHANIDPLSGKHVSFGLVRMANIDPLMDVAIHLYQLGAAENTRLHLCVYHSRFPLVQRSAIENMLDDCLNRRKPEAVYQQTMVRELLDKHPEQHHIFMVLASPVCEVGRDWDADWAIAEPSSMRSLIQLAGRVQRHRQQPPAQPNILILDYNLNHYEKLGTQKAVFARPGFEKDSGDFHLLSHRINDLLSPEQFQILNAIPRVLPKARDAWQAQNNLVDLEHARMSAAMQPSSSVVTHSRRGPSKPSLGRDSSFAVWQNSQSMLTGVLPQQQPFRENTMREVQLVFLPDPEDEEQLLIHRVEEAKKRSEKLYVPTQLSVQDIALPQSISVTPWGDFDMHLLLVQQADFLDIPLDVCAKRMGGVSVPQSDMGWRWHPLLGFSKKH